MSDAPHPFTLRQLQYVCAIAEELSFRKAAERCAVSQPSLSAQLSQVEEALGVRLFERNRSGVKVTREGRAFVERARALIVAAGDLVELARALGDPMTGTLRLGVIPTIAPYLLPLVAPGLRNRFPKLTIEWLEDKTAVLLEGLSSGRLDGALLAKVSDLRPFAQATIGRDPFLLVGRGDHPLLRSGKPVSSGELSGARTLLLDEGHCLRDQALEVCGRARAEELEFRATSLTTLVQMVAQGAGVTLLPAMASSEVARSGLKSRPWSAPAPGRTVVLAWRKAAPFGVAMERVAEALRAGYPSAGER